jgi:hypothetical protein
MGMEPGLEVLEFVKKCARTRTMGFRKLKEQIQTHTRRNQDQRFSLK